MVPVTDDRRVRIKDNFYHFPGRRFLFSHNAFIQEIQRNGFMAPPGSLSMSPLEFEEDISRFAAVEMILNAVIKNPLQRAQ